TIIVMKRNIGAGLLVVAVAVLGWFYWWGARVPKMLSIGDTAISLEIADSPNERARGLSGRTEFPIGTGMLFVFDQDDYYAFCMPDMHFAIDILWLDADYTVVHVERAVTPESYPTLFRPSSMARFVLELPAG